VQFAKALLLIWEEVGEMDPEKSRWEGRMAVMPVKCTIPNGRGLLLAVVASVVVHVATMPYFRELLMPRLPPEEVQVTRVTFVKPKVKIPKPPPPPPPKPKPKPLPKPKLPQPKLVRQIIVPKPLPEVREAPAVDTVIVSVEPPPPEPPPGPFSEKEVDVPPKLLRGPQPAYPSKALRLGVEADVILSLVVDEKGEVESIKFEQRARYGFNEAAFAAAQRLHFAPAEIKGQPVPVRVRWSYHFRLED
jgi:protein TonB